MLVWKARRPTAPEASGPLFRRIADGDELVVEGRVEGGDLLLRQEFLVHLRLSFPEELSVLGRTLVGFALDGFDVGHRYAEKLEHLTRRGRKIIQQILIAHDVNVGTAVP